MNPDVRRVGSFARLSMLLNELETALPVLVGTGTLAQPDWSDLDRRLNRVRSILADKTHRRRPRRVRSAGHRTARGGESTVAALF